MFDYLINFSLRSRGFVVLVLVGLAGSGVYSLLSLPIDAVPDITNVQVMALTDAPALGPEEVEQFITIPVENAMNGIPRIKEVRSFSQFGISVGDDHLRGRDRHLLGPPAGRRAARSRSATTSPRSSASPRWGRSPPGLGEIYQFEVRNAPDSPKPAIADGAADDPRLGGGPAAQERAGRGRGQRLRRRAEDLRGPSSTPTGCWPAGSRSTRSSRRSGATTATPAAATSERNGELRVIRGVGLVGTLKDLEEIVLDTTPSGTPIYVRDVGDGPVRPDDPPGGRRPATAGARRSPRSSYLLAGENGRVVVDRVKEKVAEIQKTLPEGVVIDPYYDRSALIEKTIAHGGPQPGRGGRPGHRRPAGPAGEPAGRA